MLTNLHIMKNVIKLTKCDYLLHNIIKSVINAVDKKYQSFTLHKPCIVDKSACCRYQSLWSCLVIGSSFLHQFQKSIFQKLILRDQREICFCRGNFVTRGWCPKFVTGLYIIIKSAFLFNFLTRIDYKHKNQFISNFLKAL